MGLLCLKRLLIWICFVGLSLSSPSIKEHPEDQKVLQGNDVTLRCVVKGISPSVQNPVQWTKGGFGLGHDRELVSWDRYSMVGDFTKGEYHLHIRNASVDTDDDKYECQVTSNQLRSKQAKVTVQVFPTGPFIEGANNDNETARVDVVVNKENMITCHALNGKPVATLQWFKGNEEIYEGVETMVSSPVNKLFNVSATLRITPSSEDYNNKYTCVMSSDEILSIQPRQKVVALNLLEPPIVSVHFPDEIRDIKHLEAHCRSHADPPVTSYRWYLNDILQTAETSATYNFGLVNKSWHGARIGCEAQNSAGYSERNVKTMNVLYPPVFLGGTDNLVADIGQNVTLRCNWDSNPNPIIHWVHEGNDVVLSRNPNLHLTNVDQADGGKYVCFATADKVGNDKAITEVTVYGPPIFDHPATQYAILGEDAQIICSLESFPGIQRVTWTLQGLDGQITLRDNQKMASEDGKIEDKFQSIFEPGSAVAKLHVAKATKDDLHSYTCTVGNRHGEKQDEIDLQEDKAKSHQAFTMGAAIGIAAGIAVFIISLLLIAWCCVRRKQEKSTNFDKNKQRAFKKDETVEVNHVKETNSGAYNVTSHSVSSHDPSGTSVSESDGMNPALPSGQDDGYHTEEANSWNRNHENSDKTEADSVSSNHKMQQPYVDYVVDLPPVPELSDSKQPLLNGQHPENDQYGEYPPRPMSANRYPYEHPAVSHPMYRSASAMDGRYSPAVGFDQRLYPDNIPTPIYAHPQAEFYPPNPIYTPLQPIAEPVTIYANHPYGSRLTPVPPTMTGYDRYEQTASQSSLDKFERESALSNSIVPTRTMEPNMGRNLHSRLSQSSKSSEFTRPLVARMATHV